MKRLLFLSSFIFLNIGFSQTFQDQLSTENIGATPSKWLLINGFAEIDNLNGVQVVKMSKGAIITPKISGTDYLDDSFSVELDLFFDKVLRSVTYQSYSIRLWPGKSSGKVQTDSGTKSFRAIKIMRHGASTSIKGNKTEKGQNYSNYLSELRNTDAEWIKMVLLYNNGDLKLYINNYEVLSIPNYDYNPELFSIEANSNDGKTELTKAFKNITINGVITESLGTNDSTQNEDEEVDGETEIEDTSIEETVSNEEPTLEQENPDNQTEKDDPTDTETETDEETETGEETSTNDENTTNEEDSNNNEPVSTGSSIEDLMDLIGPIDESFDDNDTIRETIYCDDPQITDYDFQDLRNNDYQLDPTCFAVGEHYTERSSDLFSTIWDSEEVFAFSLTAKYNKEMSLSKQTMDEVVNNSLDFGQLKLKNFTFFITVSLEKTLLKYEGGRYNCDRLNVGRGNLNPVTQNYIHEVHAVLKVSESEYYVAGTDAIGETVGAGSINISIRRNHEMSNTWDYYAMYISLHDLKMVNDTDVIHFPGGMLRIPIYPSSPENTLEFKN